MACATRRCRQDGAHQLFTASGHHCSCVYRLQPFRPSNSEHRRPAGARSLVGAGSGECVVAEALPLWACRVALALADIREIATDANECFQRFIERRLLISLQKRRSKISLLTDPVSILFPRVMVKTIEHRHKRAAICGLTVTFSPRPKGIRGSRRRTTMLKRLIICQLMILATALMSLPVSQAQTLTISDRGPDKRPTPNPGPMWISSYEDDPFVMESLVERMAPSRFDLGEDGRPVLSNNLVRIENESKIYRKDANGDFQPFAWNPWPQVGTSNVYGDFRFQDEERFPLFKQERDSDGKIILKDGLQVWTPNDLHLGMTTAFNATNAAREAG